MKEKKVYTVTAYRWNQRDNHSYIIGVFNNKGRAINMAKSHVDYRGGKYSCHVESIIMNQFDNASDEYSETVHIELGHDMS